jgi:hypothetical protein
MVRKLVIFTVLFLFSCNSIKVTYIDNDSSLLFQHDENGCVWLSSLNSSQQINITKSIQKGDTLLINYKRGALVSMNNIIPLNSNTKYLKCANKLYRVEFEGNQFKLIENK